MDSITRRINKYQNIIVYGSGGGHDIVAGYAVWKRLKQMGKTVYLVNYSFTDDLSSYEPCHAFTPHIIKVDEFTPTRQKNQDYFTEKTLSTFIHEPVYAIRPVPPRILHENLCAFVNYYSIDLIVAIDAGFDGLMYGDEKCEGSWLGSPYEDMASHIALEQIRRQNHNVDVWLMCLSVPTEGIPMRFFWRDVADLIKQGAFLGCQNQGTEPDEQQDLMLLLGQYHPSVKSIPNESWLAASMGYLDLEHYKNPSLKDRISELNEFPPVYPLTMIAWWFDLGRVHLWSPFCQYLFNHTFESDRLSSDQPQSQQEQAIIQQTMQFNHLIHTYGSQHPSTSVNIRQHQGHG